MDYFYVIVLSVAIALLILILTFIGIAFKRSSASGTTWPPVAGTCPDYWQVDPNDKNYCLIPQWSSTNPPRNVGSIYSMNGSLNPSFNPPGYDSNGNRINFNDSTYTNCNKNLFSTSWGIYWDGYTNITGCGAKTN